MNILITIKMMGYTFQGSVFVPSPPHYNPSLFFLSANSSGDEKVLLCVSASNTILDKCQRLENLWVSLVVYHDMN